MTRSEREQKRYTAVRNAYGDVKLANKARGWSDDRILNELGVKIPKSMPKLKAMPTDEAKTRKSLELTKFQYARQQGIEPIEAIRVKQYKKSKIDATKDFLTISAKTLNAETKLQRMRLWAEWSKPITRKKKKHSKTDPDIYIETNNLPPALVKLARQINADTMMDEKHHADRTDRYGFAVIYYAFVENRPVSDMQQQITIDRYSGFFFGGTEYDGYYLEDIKDTLEMLNKVLTDPSYKGDRFYYYGWW